LRSPTENFGDDTQVAPFLKSPNPFAKGEKLGEGLIPISLTRYINQRDVKK